MISPTFTSHRRRPPRERQKPPDRPCLLSHLFSTRARSIERETTFRVSRRGDYLIVLQQVRARARLRARRSLGHVRLRRRAAHLHGQRAHVLLTSVVLLVLLHARRGKRKRVWFGVSERRRGRMVLGASARTGANGESAHRAHLLQRVIRGVEVFDILFVSVRMQSAIPVGQRERSREGIRAAHSRR